MQLKRFFGIMSLSFVFSQPLLAAEKITLPAPVPCNCCASFSIGWKWNYVLSQTPNLNIVANMYDIDGFDNSAGTVSSIHAAGRKATCYIDAGTWEDWRPDANQFPASVKGNSNGWPGEKWLDIRQISILGPIMQARVNMCKSKGFDAVEFDNVDGYSNRTGFPLTAADQANYNVFLANMAHTAGLLAALKNDTDQTTLLLPYFDLNINEECFEFDECDSLAPFINANKPVFNVEYNLPASQFCPQANAMHFGSILKNVDLPNAVTFCN